MFSGIALLEADAHLRKASSEAARHEAAGFGVDSRRLEHIARALVEGEAVVCIADGLFRSDGRQCGGSAVLTDRRLLCVEHGARLSAPLEFPLEAITSITARLSGDSGAARRGEITLTTGAVATNVSRIHPCRRALDIAAYVEQRQQSCAPSARSDVLQRVQHIELCRTAGGHDRRK